MDLEFLENETEPSDLPRYGTKGWVLVEILAREGGIYNYLIEEWAVDDNASTFWIKEGEGIDFWCDSLLPEDLEPGWYVIEDVVGTYHRGDGWMTDDDVEWEIGKIRPATQEEIDSLSVEQS